MNRFAPFIPLIAAFLAACGSALTPAPLSPAVLPSATQPTAIPEPRTLTVFAAASLADAFTEISHDFGVAHPGVSVALSFAGSQTLSAQLIQGAAVDVFASANKTEMDKVVATGLVPPDTARNFLTNQLVVILPSNNPADIQTLQDLARPRLKLVLADKTVPAGKYALQILDNMARDAAFGADFKTKVLANVVSNETDVKQVVVKVQLGEADAGIAYISDAIAAPELKTLEIPANLNVIASYPIAVLTRSPQPQLATDFVACILSSTGQAILRKWGFTPLSP